MRSSVVAEDKPGCTEGLHCIELQIGEEEVAEDNVPKIRFERLSRLPMQSFAQSTDAHDATT
jgi:hypothetical protein